ncbi:hypothetical protein CGCVW01_v001283 [Colletotrichum viniferum]|nr:hypothetical protein CGCVW01_v001283 [Colletotrichum viniferum]
MLRDVWKNLQVPVYKDSETANKATSVLRNLPDYPSDIPKPRDRKKEYKNSQEPDYWFRRKALHKYFKVFVWAVVGNLFLIGPMILMVLKPGLITSLVTTSVCVTIFAAVAPKFLDKIGDVMSATAAYAAVLVVFVGTSGGGSSV